MRPDINYGTTDTNHDDITSRVGLQLVSAPACGDRPGLLQLVHGRREESDMAKSLVALGTAAAIGAAALTT